MFFFRFQFGGEAHPLRPHLYSSLDNRYCFRLLLNHGRYINRIPIYNAVYMLYILINSKSLFQLLKYSKNLNLNSCR